MDSKYPGSEIFVVVFSLCLFLGYHIWFFFFKTGLTRTSESDYYGINGKGKLARVIFTHMVTVNGKAAILGVQQTRNAMMGASFQASIGALFFNVLLDVLLNPSKMLTLQRFSENDPFLAEPLEERPPSPEDVRIGIVSALVIIVVNLAVILASTLLFVVTIRLYIHLGYFYRAASHPAHILEPADALKLTLHAQVIYTLGQRLVFFFPVTVMWLLGPLALLCTSVVVTTGVAIMDRWDPKAALQHCSSVLEYTPKEHGPGNAVVPEAAGIGMAPCADTGSLSDGRKNGQARGRSTTEIVSEDRTPPTDAVCLPVSESSGVEFELVGTHTYSARRRDAL